MSFQLCRLQGNMRMCDCLCAVNVSHAKSKIYMLPLSLARCHNFPFCFILSAPKCIVDVIPYYKQILPLDLCNRLQKMVKWIAQSNALRVHIYSRIIIIICSIQLSSLRMNLHWKSIANENIVEMNFRESKRKRLFGVGMGVLGMENSMLRLKSYTTKYNWHVISTDSRGKMCAEKKKRHTYWVCVCVCVWVSL